MGASRFLSFTVGTALAVFVPAILGAVDYGNWVVLRGIMGMLTGPTALGLVPVMAVHYVSRVVEGRRLEAMRLFKAAALLRLAVALPAVVIGCVMVWASPTLSRKAWFATWLAGSLLLRLAGNTLLLLLHGERDYKRLAIARVLQQSTVPAAIIPAYLVGGFNMVPLAAAAGDGLNALIFLGLVRRYLSWPRGWPQRSDWRVLAQFTGSMSFYSAGRRAFANAVPFLMGIAGVGAAQIGYVGLGSRLAALIAGTLQQMSRPMMPSIRVVMRTRGIQAVAMWHSFTCRAGLVICLAATGSFLLAGPLLVPLVWGEAYRGAVPIIAIILAGGVLNWVGANHSDMLAVAERAGGAAKAVFWMLSAFLTAFLFLVPAYAGRGTAFAITVGAGAFAASAMIYAWRTVRCYLGLHVTWFPIILTVGTAFMSPHLHSASSRIVATGLWCAGFMASVFVSRSLRMDEIRKVLNNVKAGANDA